MPSRLCRVIVVDVWLVDTILGVQTSFVVGRVALNKRSLMFAVNLPTNINVTMKGCDKKYELYSFTSK